jgi:cell wall-associated NlpC family hydrolase
MKAGDIVFVRGNSPLSHLIQFLDKGEFSHVAIAVSNNEILEAQYFTKSRITPFYFKDYEIIDLGLLDSHRNRVEEISESLEGKIYDYFQVFLYFIRAVLYRELKIYHNPNYILCSELIDIILTEIGIIPKDQFLGNVTPNELYRYLKTL